jgi:small-conductance mechanosensitive channel
METFSTGVYPVAVLVVLITAVFIIAIFRILKFIIPYIKLTHSQSELVLKNLPFAELVAWSIYLIWAIQYLAVRSYLVTVFPLMIFVIIILYLAWYGLKDIIAGIVFNASYSLQINDQIIVMGISGKVMAILHTRIELEDNSGQIISIPYSKLAGDVVFRNYPSQSNLSYHFKLEIPAPGSPGDIFEVMEKIRITLLALPWTSQKKPPKIAIEEENNESVLLGITIFSIDESYFPRIEKVLENEFGGKVIR